MLSLSDPTIQKFVLPLTGGAASIILGWAVNQLPALQQSRENVRLLIKLIFRIVIWTIFLGLLSDAFKVWKEGEETARVFAGVFILIFFILSCQVFWILLQLLKSTLPNQTSSESQQNENYAVALSLLQSDVPADLPECIEANQRAAQYVKSRTEKWLESINPADYQSYDISNENIKDFCEDLRRHLNLLYSNIARGVGSTPRRAKVSVPQRLGSPDLYAKALEHIKTKIDNELIQEDSARKWLKEEGIQQLYKYLNRLIDEIGD